MATRPLSLGSFQVFLARIGHRLRRHRQIVWGIGLVLTLLIFFAVVRTVPVGRLTDWAKEKADSFGMMAPFIYGLLFIVVTTLSLPGWPLTVAAGPLFGPWVGTLTMSLASTASAAVLFLVARLLASERMAKRVERHPRLRAVYKAVGEGGWRVVAAVRLSHGLPFGVQNFLFGLSTISFWIYVVTTFLVTLPGIFTQVYLGHLGGKLVEKGESSRWLTWLGLLVVAAAILYLVHFFGKVIRQRIARELEST